MTVATALFIVATGICLLLVWFFMDHVNPWGRRQDAFLAALQSMQAGHLESVDRLLSSHERQLQSVLGTAEGLAEAAVAQANSLTQHLKLFDTSGPPQVHPPRTPESEYDDWLKTTGFPTDASPADQAAWVLKRAAA